MAKQTRFESLYGTPPPVTENFDIILDETTGEILFVTEENWQELYDECLEHELEVNGVWG